VASLRMLTVTYTPAVPSLPAAGLLVRDAPGMSAVASIATVPGSILASSDTVESEGRQMIQC
jgi:hypothetical protein